MNRPTKYSKWWFSLAVVPVLAGVFGMLWILYSGLAKVHDSIQQIEVPGNSTVHLIKGKCAIFHEFQSTVNGKTYKVDPVAFNNIDLKVIAPISRTELDLKSVTMKGSYNFSDRRANLVRNFWVPEDGDYTVITEPEPGREPVRTVLGFVQGFAGQILGIVTKCVLVLGLGFIAGGIVGGIVYRKLEIR